MDQLLQQILTFLVKRFGKERRVSTAGTTVTRNSQDQRINASGIVFWNQGTTEVVINSNYRLAPATQDPITGKFVGGESFRYEDPTGRIFDDTFTFTFSPDTGNSGYPVINSLIIVTVKHVKDA